MNALLTSFFVLFLTLFGHCSAGAQCFKAQREEMADPEFEAYKQSLHEKTANYISRVDSLLNVEEASRNDAWYQECQYLVDETNEYLSVGTLYYDDDTTETSSKDIDKNGVTCHKFIVCMGGLGYGLETKELPMKCPEKPQGPVTPSHVDERGEQYINKVRTQQQQEIEEHY